MIKVYLLSLFLHSDLEIWPWIKHFLKNNLWVNFLIYEVGEYLFLMFYLLTIKPEFMFSPSFLFYFCLNKILKT